jgi:ABC-2 type transport system permease protein
MAHKIIRTFTAPIKHWWIVFTAETKRLAAYRAQFWFELILSSIIELMVALAVWRAVFESTGETYLNGFSYQMMALYLTVAIFFGQAAKGTGVGTFQREVYEGTLTRYLIYPLSIYSFKLGTFMPRAIFALGQLLVALSVISLLNLWPQEIHVGIYSATFGLLALLMACLIYFLLIMCLESFSFWADNVWALSYALQVGIVFLSGKAIPLDLFPIWAQSILNVSPFPLLVYFPVQAFLGQLPAEVMINSFMLSFTWIISLYLLSKFIISRGLYKYSGVGQ